MKAVSLEKLKVGMVLARTVVDSNFVIVLSENTALTETGIKRLQTLDVPFIYIKDQFDLSKNFQQAESVDKKDAAFSHDFNTISKLAGQIFSELKVGKKADETVTKLAAQILPLAGNHASINYLFNLGHMNKTLELHSERVSIIAGTLAKWMKLDWEEIRTVVTAAFLHDVGKREMPEEILTKNPKDFSDEEKNIYRTHCQKGFEMLKDANFAEPIPTVALQHHETMNGEGFPNGLAGEKIHLFSRIVAVADAYEHWTSEREGDVKKTPFDAVNFFIREIYYSFDPGVCVPLLTRIKDSLIGSSVTLSDGRKGRVIFYPQDFSAMPIVVTEDGQEINLNLRKNLSITQYEIK